MKFFAATKSAETYAYRKPMGPECNGMIRGVGNGVALSKFRSGIRTSESTMISMLLKEVKNLQQEVAHLKSSRGDPKVHSPAFFFAVYFVLAMHCLGY